MRPFPFNLSGPEFLLFFAVLGVCVVGFPLVRRRWQGADAADLFRSQQGKGLATDIGG